MVNKGNRKNLDQAKKEEVLCAALKKFGFLFPQNEDEVEEFERTFGSTNYPLPADLESLRFLHDASDKSNSDEDKVEPSPPLVVNIKPATRKRQGDKQLAGKENKPTNIDYYRRTVLAAEIVQELHNEITFGHVKLQKLIFLSQKTEKMAIPVNFLKQAMGPFDPVMMRSIDKQLLIKKWFTYNQSSLLKYQPLERAGGHQEDFQRYYTLQYEKIKWLIDTFRKEKTGRVELVATLYACWEELLKEGKEVLENDLIAALFSWSKEKEKFAQTNIPKEIAWMREHGLVP